MKKVLMTGSTGFIGKRILNVLTRADDVDLTLITSHKVAGYKCLLHRNWKLSEKSISEKFDCLVLLGGVTPKGKNTDKEEHYIKNISSTINVLDALKQLPPRVIFVSSVSVYEDCNIEISEDSQLTTQSLYGLSKIVSEKYLKCKCRERGARLTILRLGPVYGPGEEIYNKIVGSFIKQAVNYGKICINSDGREKRNLIFVDDVARLIIALILSENIKDIGIVNVVSPNSISVFELATEIVNNCIIKPDIYIANAKEGRSDLYSANKIMEIYKLLNLQFTSYEDGIAYTYSYFKEQGIE